MYFSPMHCAVVIATVESDRSNRRDFPVVCRASYWGTFASARGLAVKSRTSDVKKSRSSIKVNRDLYKTGKETRRFSKGHWESPVESFGFYARSVR